MVQNAPYRHLQSCNGLTIAVKLTIDFSLRCIVICLIYMALLMHFHKDKKISAS